VPPGHDRQPFIDPITATLMNLMRGDGIHNLSEDLGTAKAYVLSLVKVGEEIHALNETMQEINRHLATLVQKL